MTTQEIAFITWFKKIWLGHLHSIQPRQVQEASGLMGEQFDCSNSWSFNAAVQRIHNYGISLLNKEEAEQKQTSSFDIKLEAPKEPEPEPEPIIPEPTKDEMNDNLKWEPQKTKKKTIKDDGK